MRPLARPAALVAILGLVQGGVAPSAASCSGPLRSRVVQGAVTACEEPDDRATAALTRLFQKRAESRRQIGIPIADVDVEAVLAPTLARPQVLLTLEVEFSLDMNAAGRKRWQYHHEHESLEVVMRGVQDGCASLVPGMELRLVQSGVCCDLYPPTDTTCILHLDTADFVPESMATPRLNKEQVREKALRNAPTSTETN